MGNNYTNIIGPLVGVLIGWFLGLLSNAGRVRFNISKWSVEYYEPDNAGSFLKKELNEHSDSGDFAFEIDISNTSRNNRMLREISCSVEIDKNKICKNLYDSDTARVVAAHREYDKIEILNIPSQDIIKKNLFFSLSKDDLAIIINSKAIINFNYVRLWGLRRKKKIFITYLLKGSIN